MGRYRKKPVVIEAFKWTGGPAQLEDPEWIVDAIKRQEVWFGVNDEKDTNPIMFIATLEGTHRANVGDYIIKGIKGEIYPCKPDIFEATYEDVINNKNNTLSFEEVLPLIKQGKKAYREGWNGRGMFVVRQKGYPAGIPCNKQTAEAWDLNEGDLFKVNPYLQIKNADGSHAMWVPSIGDIFANDWKIK